MSLMELEGWQDEHESVMKEFLKALNRKTDSLVLKGGTAIIACYGSPRFSNDMDFDSTHRKIIDFAKKFAESKGYGIRVAKNTEKVQRVFLDYGSKEHPLKIEVSFRRNEFDKDSITRVNGISVYTVDELTQMKALAYQGRDKIRDIYDLCYLCNNFSEHISKQTFSVVRNVLAYKGLDNFDYIVQTQKDSLIDSNELADNFLKLYDKVGLLYDDKDKKIVKEYVSDKGKPKAR